MLRSMTSFIEDNSNTDGSYATTLTFNDIDIMLKTIVSSIDGCDTDDGEYTSVKELWDLFLPKAHPNQWYTHAYDFWEQEAFCPLTDDGVLGGYGKVTDIDVRDSNIFLDNLCVLLPNLKSNRVADCGAGIGRVTKHFLLNRFNHVDLIEQSPRLLHGSTDYIGKEAIRTTQILVGLQDFTPIADTYDVIWIQWVIGHLHDIDFITFFRRCKHSLKKDGVIVLKDNCTESWTFVVDKQDSSVARNVEYIRLLIALSGLSIVLETKQTDFPSELYPVIMFAMR